MMIAFLRSRRERLILLVAAATLVVALATLVVALVK